MVTPKEGERVVNVRDLDAKSWLRTTGLLEMIHRDIDRQLGVDDARTKHWQQEAMKPVTFRAVPSPLHEITHAMGVRSREISREATCEAQGTYMAQR